MTRQRRGLRQTEYGFADGDRTAVVNFGNDVPANLLGLDVLVDTPALDGQLQTHDGQSVTLSSMAAAISLAVRGDRGRPHSSGERGPGSSARAM